MSENILGEYTNVQYNINNAAYSSTYAEKRCFCQIHLRLTGLYVCEVGKMLFATCKELCVWANGCMYSLSFTKHYALESESERIFDFMYGYAHISIAALDVVKLNSSPPKPT